MPLIPQQQPPYYEIDENLPPPPGGGGVQSVTAGNGITVDNTDPDNPIIETNPGYLEYTALINQTGTGDPTPTVLTNTIGAIAWTRQTTGTYRAILTGAFTASKTTLIVNPGDGTGPQFRSFYRYSADQLYLITFNPGASEADSLLTNGTVQIKVYP